MSSFGDRRTYTHDGETIDRQVHLGFDLASVARAPVEATQAGVVVLAEPLGIYGSTVVLDHGLGVFSLYGHLSTIAVQPGQSVPAGAVLGQSGETGLAGGDHLHFSIIVRGNHVDPVEWWDPQWMRDHVTSKLEMFPLAEAPAAGRGADPAPGEEGDGEARP
jgi:murein DD-endopeptidase MepM/ murein hydrolase activator NlpD